jgi:hypothetical protein
MIHPLWGLVFFAGGWIVSYIQNRNYDKKD